MQKTISITCLFLILITVFKGVGSLKNVQLKVPSAISPGDTATLICSYDLEDDPLYTVTWYKGRKEFFRFVPKELPHTRVFPLPGFRIDVDMSGPDRVVLRDVSLNMTGRYLCEVSADAPSFHTHLVSAHMNVIPALNGSPELTMEKGRYALGDVIRGNCSSPPSKPAANVTWYINEEKINASFVIRDRVGDRYVTTAGIEQHLDIPGKQRIICVADIYEVVSTQTEIFLEEERPRLASVLGTRESTQNGCEAKGDLFSIWLIELTLLTFFSQR
ncbi:uncharacterized protein LOC142321793 [Lycorma delicatula]|uniref:uncharacterized protein LOC142321793 n=1 Tax=Lycorma delicatula TaxID=130591 RepID=UPI003F51970E